LAIRIFRDWSFARSLFEDLQFRVGDACHFGSTRSEGNPHHWLCLLWISAPSLQRGHGKKLSAQVKESAVSSASNQTLCEATVCGGIQDGDLRPGSCHPRRLDQEAHLHASGGLPGEQIHQDEQEGALVMPGSGWESKRIESFVADLAHRDLEAIS
jgi:hypothetical protein